MLSQTTLSRLYLHTLPDLSLNSTIFIRARCFSPLLSLSFLLRGFSHVSSLFLVFPFLSFISTTVKRELLAPVKVNRALNDVDYTRTVIARSKTTFKLS